MISFENDCPSPDGSGILLCPPRRT